MKFSPSCFLVAALLSVSSLPAFAQAPDAAGGDNRRGGGRGNYEEFRKRMVERLKTSLKTTDEEWTVLQPLVENVYAKQRDAMIGGRGFGGGRGGRGGDNNASGNTGGGDQTARTGSKEADELRAATEKDGASPEELKSKMAAVRDARKKAQADLVQAREELRKVLTVRQEAVLLSLGLLE